MAKLSGIVKQLKKERDQVKKQLSGLNAALSAFVGAYTNHGETDTQTPQDVSEGESQDCSRTESPMEGLEGKAEKSRLTLAKRGGD